MRFMYGYLTTIFNIIWLKRYYLEYLLTLSYLGGISFQVVRSVPGRLGCHQRLPVMLYRCPPLPKLPIYRSVVLSEECLSKSRKTMLSAPFSLATCANEWRAV